MKLFFLFSTLVILLISLERCIEAKDHYYRPSSSYYNNNYNNGGYHSNNPFPGFNLPMTYPTNPYQPQMPMSYTANSYQPPMPMKYTANSYQQPTQAYNQPYPYNCDYPNYSPGYNPSYQTPRPLPSYPYSSDYKVNVPSNSYYSHQTPRPAYSAPYTNYNNGYPQNSPYPIQRQYMRPNTQPAYYPSERMEMQPKKTNYYSAPYLKNQPATSYLLAEPMGYYMCHNHGQPVTPYRPPANYRQYPTASSFQHEAYSSYPAYSDFGYQGNYVSTPPVSYQSGYRLNKRSAPSMGNKPSPVPYVIGPDGQPCTFMFF